VISNQGQYGLYFGKKHHSWVGSPERRHKEILLSVTINTIKKNQPRSQGFKKQYGANAKIVMHPKQYNDPGTRASMVFTLVKNTITLSEAP
jgi:hypothetical protein